MTNPVSSVPVPFVDSSGLHLPFFADILTALQNDYRAVYGADVYLGNDSQDGQLVGIRAAALNDVFAVALQVYNAFSPATAQGTGLSSVVKVNGIRRLVPTFSTVDLVVVGQAGTIIAAGVAIDINNNKWSMPPTVTIPGGGTITVTATCQVPGAIAAPANSVSGISTPTRGWQTVNNPTTGTPGAPLESDPQLRVRQSLSTMLPSQNVLDGILGAIAAIPGVLRFRGYENSADAADANGQPGHSIAIVVDGGDATAIATAISLKKTPGAATYGTTTVTITDAYGISRAIKFYRPTQPPITFSIAVHNLVGYTTDVQAAIQQAVSDWTNALGIGAGTAGKIMLPRVYGPALLGGTAFANTFEINSITMARDGGTLAAADITIAFNEAPFCVPANVTVIAS